MNRAYRTETRKFKVGCGELRVRIAFKGDGSFHFILLDLDNYNNECGCCFLNVMQNGFTALLRRIELKELPAMLKNLKGQRCRKEYGLENCPNKIAQALQEAFKDKISA